MLKKGLGSNMNKYAKEYIKRGLIFSGLGPVVFAIVISIIEACGTKVALSSIDVLKAILATYIVAFVHAGGSVFPSIEKWSKMKAFLFQGGSIYFVYLFAYLINNWLPLNWIAIGLYTACFWGSFAITWLIVIFVTKKSAKKMNESFRKLMSVENEQHTQ